MPDAELLWRTRRIAVLFEHMEGRSSMRLTEECKEWVALVKADAVSDKRMTELLNHVLVCARAFKPKNEYEKTAIDSIMSDIGYVTEKM